MINIKLKGTSINIECNDNTELFTLYRKLGHDYILIINGEELQKMGPTGKNSYFAGYSRSFFNKF